MKRMDYAFGPGAVGVRCQLKDNAASVVARGRRAAVKRGAIKIASGNEGYSAHRLIAIYAILKPMQHSLRPSGASNIGGQLKDIAGGRCAKKSRTVSATMRIENQRTGRLRLIAVAEAVNHDPVPVQRRDLTEGKGN